MLSHLVGHKASITLQPYQSAVYLHPLKEYERTDQALPQEQTLHGSITISLPKPREITSLVVKLVAYYNIAIPNQPPESGILEEFSCNLDIPKMFEKGEHTFAWSILVPRKSAPQERCMFGRIYQRLHAIAESPTGILKEEMPLQIIVNPADEGDTMGLNETIEGFHDAVGPYRLTLTSGHLTVGGVVHFTMNLPSVPAELRLRSVTALFIQSFSLTSCKNGKNYTPSSQQRQLFQIDSRTLQRQSMMVEPATSPLSARKNTVVHSTSVVPPGEDLLGLVHPGDGFEVSHVARMPVDDLLRPTTQPGSQTPIRVSHKVVIEVLFSSSQGQELALRSERSVTITSCCCMLESLLLPSYTEALNEVGPPILSKEERRRRLRFNCSTECLCGFSLERLLLKTHAPILKAHEESGSGDLEASQAVFKGSKIP